MNVSENLCEMCGQELLLALYKARNTLDTKLFLTRAVENANFKKDNVKNEIERRAKYCPNTWVWIGVALSIIYMLSDIVSMAELVSYRMALKKWIFWCVMMVVIVLAGILVYYMLLSLDSEIFKTSKLQKAEAYYSEEYKEAIATVKQAEQRLADFLKSEQMSFVENILPEKFKDLSALNDLIHLMEVHSINNLNLGILEYDRVHGI